MPWLREDKSFESQLGRGRASVLSCVRLPAERERRRIKGRPSAAAGPAKGASRAEAAGASGDELRISDGEKLNAPAPCTLLLTTLRDCRCCSWSSCEVPPPAPKT